MLGVFPDFYKVAVAGVPPRDHVSMYADYHWSTFEGQPHYANGSQWRPGAMDKPENWSSADSNAQAGTSRVSLLIVMGELSDENVLPGSTLQFTNALIKANKDFDTLFLPGPNHYESSRPYVVRRLWDYLVKNLQAARRRRSSICRAATAARNDVRARARLDCALAAQRSGRDRGLESGAGGGLCACGGTAGTDLEAESAANVFVTPHWIGGRDEFRYRREGCQAGVEEFVRVDAASGAKRAAFDHAAVAQALSAALGTPVDGNHLPFDELNFSANGKTLKSARRRAQL